MILRRPPGGTKPKSGHDMGREYRVMKALAPHFPCPRVLAYTEDPALLGAPFYVMEKVEGIILRRDLPKGLSYTPERARRLCLNLVDALIRLLRMSFPLFPEERSKKSRGMALRARTLAPAVAESPLA